MKKRELATHQILALDQPEASWYLFKSFLQVEAQAISVMLK